MANEITITVKQLVVNGNYKPGELSDAAVRFDQLSPGGASGTLLVTQVAEVQLSPANLTTRGILWLKNLDPANYISWGFATAVYGGQLLPDEPNMFRTLGSTTLYLIANVADCQMQWRWLEA